MVTEFRLNRAGEWQQSGSRSIPYASDALAMNDAIFAVVGDGSQLHLIDPATGKTNSSFNVPLDPNLETRRFAFTSDGQKLAMLSKNETFIELWDVPQGRLLGTFPPGLRSGQTLVFSKDGRYLSALTGTGMRVYDTGTFSTVDQFNASSGRGNPQSFLPGTSLLAAPSSTLQEVHIRDFLRKENMVVLQEGSRTRQCSSLWEGNFC